jgi:hypothetical protein
MTGLVAGIGLKAALGGATARLASIPPKAWLAIGGALALVLGVLAHHIASKRHDAALVKSTIAAEDSRLAKQALAIKQKADALNAQIATLIREKNDETNRAIAADAHDVLVHGPGKARVSCPVVPAPPVDLSQPLPSAMLPDLHCLQTTSQPCRGNGSQPAPKSTTGS